MNTILKRYPYPKLIAHRGAGKEAPENTLSAFRHGFLQGFTMFECDVKLSADKTLFLLHDADLARTTNGSGLAKDQTWDMLSRFDAGKWHSSLYTGEPLPRFESLVQFILDNRLRLDIELKPNEGEAYETGRAVVMLLKKVISERFENCLDLLFNEDMDSLFQRLYDELLAAPTPFCVKNQFLLTSFDPEALRGAYEAVPEIPRALLIDDWVQGEAQILATLTALDCAGIVLNYQIISAQFIEECHENGRFVMVYTANKLVEIKSLLSRGVDSVITDNMQAVNDLGLI